MNTDNENMQAISRAVLTQAQADAERIVADAKAKAKVIRQQAEKQAAAERKQVLETAQREADDTRKQAKAAAELKARMLVLERREKLLNAVFDAVRERLPSVQQREDYDDVVRGLVLEAVTHIGGDSVEIRADRQAQQLLTDVVLAALSQQAGTQVQLGEPLENAIGVVVQTRDGHRRHDNTLDARLSRDLDGLRPSVYRLLMGESA
jgi:vacuolar-type H+-ATPase subunit E/Vma4